MQLSRGQDECVHCTPACLVRLHSGDELMSQQRQICRRHLHHRNQVFCSFWDGGLTCVTQEALVGVISPHRQLRCWGQHQFPFGTCPSARTCHLGNSWVGLCVDHELFQGQTKFFQELCGPCMQGWHSFITVCKLWPLAVSGQDW
jgi:hypothetical protein